MRYRLFIDINSLLAVIYTHSVEKIAKKQENGWLRNRLLIVVVFPKFRSQRLFKFCIPLADSVKNAKFPYFFPKKKNKSVLL